MNSLGIWIHGFCAISNTICRTMAITTRRRKVKPQLIWLLELWQSIQKLIQFLWLDRTAMREALFNAGNHGYSLLLLLTAHSLCGADTRPCPCRSEKVDLAAAIFQLR